jgi:hypothetical protein
MDWIVFWNYLFIEVLVAFNNQLALIRKIGRNAVLPVDGIKTICRETLADKNIKTVLDFGAGTLFWSYWFTKEFKITAYAVDVYYANAVMPENWGGGITCYSNLSTCLSENSEISFVWACDVLHHLSPLESDTFLKEICNKTNIIIIKDIDCRYRFGNFMNKMHDKIINGETIYDVCPNKLNISLKSYGFKTSYYYMPKIWYPHFILTAIRS